MKETKMCQTYNPKQVHALIAKHRLENNIPALMELGENYPKMQAPIRDMVTAYISKSEKVVERLRKVGL